MLDEALAAFDNVHGLRHSLWIFQSQEVAEPIPSYSPAHKPINTLRNQVQVVGRLAGFKKDVMLPPVSGLS